MSEEIIEEWKLIPEYENYKVSNLGRVKSLKFCKELIMKQNLTKYGYYQIGLCKDGKLKRFYVHQLVVKSFICEIPIGKVVNHINGIKTDNRVENLEIVTQRENLSIHIRKDRETMSSPLPGAHWSKTNKKWCSQIIYKKKAYSLGYFDTDKEASDKWYKTKSYIDNGTFKEYYEKLKDSRYIKVLQFTKSGEFIREWKSATEASKELNIYQGNICICCRGKLKSAGGFIWKYTSDCK